eukprot:gene7944-10035_t
MAVWFTSRDVRRQLAYLGYYNVPEKVLQEFTQDLIALAHKEATFGSDPDEISLSSQEEHSQESFTIKSKEKTNGKWSKLPQRLKIVSPGKARLRNYQRTSFEKFDSNDRPLSTTNSSWSDQNSSQHSVLQSMSTNKPHSLRRRRKTANMDGSVLETVQKDVWKEKQGLMELLDDMDKMTIKPEMYSDVSSRSTFEDLFEEDDLDISDLSAGEFTGKTLPPVPDVDDIRPLANRTGVIPRRPPSIKKRLKS